MKRINNSFRKRLTAAEENVKLIDELDSQPFNGFSSIQERILRTWIEILKFVKYSEDFILNEEFTKRVEYLKRRLKDK